MPHGITQCYLPPGRGDIPALTSSFGEAVDLVRLLGLGAVQLLDLVDVRRLVERAAKSSLELRVVGFRVALLPTTRVLRPLLHAAQHTAHSGQSVRMDGARFSVPLWNDLPQNSINNTILY